MLLLRLRHDTRALITKYRRLTAATSASETLYDALDQRLAMLFPIDFLTRLDLSGCDHLERYLKSLSIRSERAYHNPGKDAQKQAKLSRHQARLATLADKPTEPVDTECEELCKRYAFLVDEFHVSLFSPELKTAVNVSEKILDQLWDELRRNC